MENTCTAPGTQYLVNTGYSSAHFKWVRKVTPYLRVVEKDDCFLSLGEMATSSLGQGK